MQSRPHAVPFWVALATVTVLLLAPQAPVPTGPPQSDKVTHALLFLALAGLGGLARFPLVPLGIGLTAYAVATEVLQAILPFNRYGDPRDALADLVGVAVGIALVVLVRRVTGAGPAGRSPSPPPG